MRPDGDVWFEALGKQKPRKTTTTIIIRVVTVTTEPDNGRGEPNG